MINNEALVAELIRRHAIKNSVLIEAFLNVDRADFVLPQYQTQAYLDEPLPLRHGATISQPKTVAFMLELLNPLPKQKILDVGAGSGWTTALLSECVTADGRVIGVEKDPEVLKLGQTNLKKYDYPQSEIILTQKIFGLPREAPFDRILVSASAEQFPHDLAEQLGINGIMVVPVQHSLFKAVKFSATEIEITEYPGFSFVPLE